MASPPADVVPELPPQPTAADRLSTLTAAIAATQVEHTAVREDIAAVQADRRTAEVSGDVVRATALADKVVALVADRDRLAERIASFTEAQQIVSLELQREEWSARLAQHEPAAQAKQAEAFEAAASVVVLMDEIFAEIQRGIDAENECATHAAQVQQLRRSLDPDRSAYVGWVQINRPTRALLTRYPVLAELIAGKVRL